MTPRSGRANRRILIVDDTASIHADFRKILCVDANNHASLDSIEETLFGNAPAVRQTFVLDSAYQGQEALELVNKALAANTPYALVFIDMRMPPGWDGLETIEQLWNVDPNLQIALCTAYSDYSFEAIEARLTYDDQLLILKKPFDDLEIRQMATALTWKWQLAQDAAAKLIGLERTIEARVQELLKVSHLLQYDALTELPNSTLLGDRLTQAITVCRRHGSQLAVMFIGLDRFKRINNALGYPVGDEMLKLVSQSLVATVRESDSVFRYGSDEFVLILNDIKHFTDGNQALHFLFEAPDGPARNGPALVLLDLNMPGAYGFSGLVLLRGQYPQIPVVMVSAQEDADVVVRSKEFGASGFIPKSSAMEDIQNAVRKVLDGDVSWPPQAFEEINVSDEAKAARDGLASLTPQQFRVLTMVCEGLLNKQIAYELSVSEATIKAHVTAIFRKLGVRTRTQAALLLQQLESISQH